jgi:hypothetical protein
MRRVGRGSATLEDGQHLIGSNGGRLEREAIMPRVGETPAALMGGRLRDAKNSLEGLSDGKFGTGMVRSRLASRRAMLVE